jgi:hypothetical protein
MSSTVSHRSAAVLSPLSTFVMEVLPWAASGVIGLYLLWATCLAPDPAEALSPDEPVLSSVVPATPPAVVRRTWGVAALPDNADQM